MASGVVAALERPAQRGDNAPVADHVPVEKVIDSIHSSDGMYCVDVVKTRLGFTLQTCRRDEGRWQVMGRASTHHDREDATRAARALAETLE
jgi:hypothetical protein